MNLTLTNTNKTMSSLEIARLTGKSHHNVLRDIRKTLAKAEVALLKFEEREKYNNGNTREIYNLPRLECDLVISGYSVKYRYAIIKRWHELENKTPSISHKPNYSLMGKYGNAKQQIDKLKCALGEMVKAYDDEIKRLDELCNLQRFKIDTIENHE